jgi:hypothetical protein
LPEELEQGFLDQILAYEKEKQMPYINTAERLGMKRGLQKGTLTATREAVLEILEVRFGATSDMAEHLLRIEDPGFLKKLHRKALQVQSLEEFEREMAQP